MNEKGSGLSGDITLLRADITLSRITKIKCFIVLRSFSGIGVNWNNFYKPVTVDDDFSIGHVFFMFIIDCFLYSMITWFVDAVFPGEYGIPKPWYFACTVSEQYTLQTLAVSLMTSPSLFPLTSSTLPLSPLSLPLLSPSLPPSSLPSSPHSPLPSLAPSILSSLSSPSFPPLSFYSPTVFFPPNFYKFPHNTK